MIDLKKVQQLILDATPVLGRESVPILDALHRVLVRDITVVEDLPASDISALDGYAVSHRSLEGVATDRPGCLDIIGEAPAGRPCSAVVGIGQAVRIMTGGLIPRGADTVVKIEDTSEINGSVICYNSPAPGTGIRFQGDSLKKGRVILHAGDVVGPPEVGTLASLRRANVYVHRKPVVAVLSTGDELSDFHEPPSVSKAMCSNIYSLAAQVVEAGGIPMCLGIVRDDLDALDDILTEAVRADIIITSGGTSKGRYDLVHTAFDRLGIKMRYTNRFEKPGKPTVFGTIANSLVFGLPGNPTATMLSFEQFIRPALLKMLGHENIFKKTGEKEKQRLFAGIDSFNYRAGGNKEHHRAPQIPLEAEPSDINPSIGQSQPSRLKMAAY